MSNANDLKEQGNKAFAAKDYGRAIELFTQAIALDPSNHVLYSNRSAAHAGGKYFSEALDDADKCVGISPSWGKGYVRRGAALHGLGRYDDAIAAYEEGLKFEDSSALRRGLREVRDARDAREASGIDNPFAKILQDPSLMAKLAANPRTRAYLADKSFMDKLSVARQNPALAPSLLSSDDRRMIDVFGVAMGIDMQGFGGPPDSDVPFSPASAASHEAPPPSASTSKPAPEPTPEPPAHDVEMTEEEQEAAKATAEAAALKARGSAFYKERRLDEAADCFSQAWELCPKDITLLTNLAAAYFEQGEYDKCIETCDKAVEQGRSLHADFKLVAKALGRAGSAYMHKGDLPSAKIYFQKSLSEHRDAAVLSKLQAAEKAMAEAERKAYIDPALSAVAREEGNVAFKGGDFAGAVKHYTESIQRDPSDARGYNNRAAAYMKLLALPEALKDAEESIAVDATFVKAYVRKAAVLHSMREYTRALDALSDASKADTAHAHTSEIKSQELKVQQALFSQRAGETEEQTLERAMRDPEVAKIMTDPVMQQILQQAQGNPMALQDHMKSPIIREKIIKLINAGIIKTR